MKIIIEGKDIYNKVNKCGTCGCLFETNRDDALISCDNDVCKHYVQCPSCYSYILMGISRQGFILKGDKK